MDQSLILEESGNPPLSHFAVEDLAPDYTGIRPKLVGPGAADADFSVETAEELGVEGLVLLQGIESPGLTSSLAIAEYVARRSGW